MAQWQHCVRTSVRSTGLVRGFCDSSTHSEFAFGLWEAKKKKITRSLESIVLGVGKRVQFDKQPRTLPSSSNVLRTLGLDSLTSDTMDPVSLYAKERQCLNARAETRWRQDGPKFVAS